jgi:hypothetical protein
MSKESRHKRWLEKQQKLQAAHAVQRANRRGTMLNPAPDPRDEHAALRALLESPYTALSVAIIFGALALSGKFSVSASQFFFVLAWGVAIIGLRGQPLALFVGLSAIIGGVLVILAYFFRPDVVPSYAGILMPKGGTIFSFNGPALISKIEVGTTGTTFTLSKPGEIGTLLMPFLSESQFKVETVKGKSRISAGITDQSGNIIVELIRNEWKVASRYMGQKLHGRCLRGHKPSGKNCIASQGAERPCSTTGGMVGPISRRCTKPPKCAARGANSSGR